MNGSFKLSVSSLLTILIFITQFISLPYISWYNLLRYATIVAVGLYICPKIKVVLKKKYLPVNSFALLFSLLTVCTAYLNKNRMTTRNPFLAAIVFTASFLLFLSFMEIMAEQGMIKKIIGIFFKTSLVFTLITDILIFAAPFLYGMYNQYLVGTKFAVVYLHLLLILFYLVHVNFSEKKWLKKDITLMLSLLTAWSFIIGIYVDCSTGIIGLFVLLILIMIIDNNESLVFNGIFYCVTQFFCFGFVFFCEFILSNQIVQNFIVNILQRDITLTSRTSIYAKVPGILTIYKGWIIGLGYGSSYELGTKYGGFPNAQNGILNWIWQVGLPTTVIMVVMFASILNLSKKYMDQNNKKVLLPLISGLYLFTILGTVEITMSVMYFSLAVCIMGVAVGTCGNKIK